MRLLRHSRGNPETEYVEAYPTAPPLDSTPTLCCASVKENDRESAEKQRLIQIMRDAVASLVVKNARVRQEVERQGKKYSPTNAERFR